MKRRKLSEKNWLFSFLAFGIFFYAASLHIHLIQILPDPFMEPDSGGYFVPVLNYLHTGAFDVPAVRGYGYPLFLLVVIKLFGKLAAVLWTQHVLALLTALIAAWICFRHIVRSLYFAGAVFFILSVSPRAVFYAHELLTETLFSFLQISSVALLYESLYRRKTWAGAAGLSISLLPHVRALGQALFWGQLFALPLWKARTRHKMTLSLSVCFFALLAGFAVNRVQRGFWGVERQGALYLFGNLVRYANVEKIQDPELRDVLRPYFQAPLSEQMKDLNWIWQSPDGPARKISQHPRFAADPDSPFRQVIRHAIRESPIRILSDSLRLAMEFILRGAKLPPAGFMRKEIGMQESLQRFYHWTLPFPQLRSLVQFHPDQSQDYLEKIHRATVFPFEPGPLWQRPAWWLRPFFPLLPCLGFAALPILILRPRGRRLLLLILPIILIQITLITAGGTYVWRYSYPFEPLYLLLSVGALAGLARHFQRKVL